jgi:uncharacterized integral membrane protein
MEPVAQSNTPAKKPWQGGGPGGLSWKAIVLAVLGIYALLLIILNSKKVSVDFVFFSAETSVFILVLLTMALGALIMWLVPRIRQHRKERRSAPAPVSPPRDEIAASGSDMGTAG